MRVDFWVGAIVLFFAVAPASAQTTSAIGLESSAVGAQDATEPVAGANSFAEGQARSLVQSKGYDNVSPLTNDRHGIWHGTATKDQNKVDVSVDYKGHVIAR